MGTYIIMEKQVLGLFIIFVTLIQKGTPYFCNLTSNIDRSKWPQLPELPESFRTNIELNIVDQSSTLDIVEYFDNVGNRVALYTTKEGLDGSVVYDFETNEVFYVTHGVCLVANLTQRPEADLFGITESDGRLHVMTSSTALKFGDQYNETYIGTDVIRGITVDHWRACLHWSRSYANFTVDYYFTKPNQWKTSSAFLTVPVRADVVGEYIHKDGSTKPIHHVYEYHAFTGSFDFTETVFETPPGVICKGRKKTKPLPKFPKQFSYKQEIALVDIVTFREVWYSDNDYYKYARFDSRPFQPTNKFYTTNPLTEILDFNTGVHYFRDKILGNCTVLPLEKTSFGAIPTRTASNDTGYFKLDMKNPLELFYLDGGFTYVGERPCRDMTCDVFSSIRRDIVINGANDTANTTIEIFFMNSDTTNYPDVGQSVPKVVPVKMTLEADAVGFSETIQFYDFESGSTDLSAFDVSSCYDDMSKLQFKVRFPGLITEDRHKNLLQLAQLRFAQTMGIEITRIQNLRLDKDIAEVYIHATLLDKTPSTAQFSYVGNLEVLDEGDMYIGNVLTPMQCSELCVNVSNFTCNSFDFCQNDPQKACRLNRKHVSDGLRVKTSSACDHFSRSMDGPGRPQLTIMEAYQKLQSAIYSQQFSIQVEFDTQEMAYYLGVDTSIEFGNAKPATMPSFDGMFSYHQEMVIPGKTEAIETQVWYDSAYKFVRYDYHDSKPTAPYYTTNPMTMIHDFNTGLQYTLDKYYRNCTISPINMRQFDSEIDNMQAYVNDKSYAIKMKNPLEMFHLKTQTKFIGQRTVRNLLCDVFLGEIKNYTMQGLNGSHPALLEYYFLTKSWNETGQGDGIVTYSAPVKLDITIVDKGLFYTYNFFDFEPQHPSLSVFDIQQCYDIQQKHRFQITFPGKFHPYLDIYRKVFLEEAILAISQSADVSVIRVQEIRLDHDQDNIYITATLMDKPPFLADFTKIPGKVMPRKTNGFFTDISTADECAHACVQTTSFPCNSFDICSSVHYCFLSNLHVQDGKLVSNESMCDHYSRTVNASSQPTPDLYTAYISLKNDIYAQIISINIPTNDSKIITYKAASIRDTLTQDTNVPQGGRPLRSFSLFKNNAVYKTTEQTLQGVAVDDCAVACLMEEMFDCQSFEYCTATELCYLSKIQPEVNSTLLVDSPTCDLYSRIYLSRYDKTPGVQYTTKGYLTLTNIPTDNMCAKQCSQRSECKSFDYCTNTKTCELRKTHKLDMPKSLIKGVPTCSHYSRKYVDDFIVKVGRDMMIDSSQEILDVTVDQCAKLCVEQEASNCSSFIYCGNQTVCQLKSVPSGQAPIVASQFCDLYTRNYFPWSQQPASNCIQPTVIQTSHTPPQHVTMPINKLSTKSQQMNNHSQICSPQTQKIVTKNNPGVLVGVALGLFIAGTILGAVVSHFYRRYKSRSDDISMNIINSNYTQ